MLSSVKEDFSNAGMQPLLLLCGFWVVLCFVTSVVSKNYSQVDKLWSITPWLYVWLLVAQDASNAKLWLMAAVTTMWGLRLTYNFSRRGGYQWPPWEGEEDYRWEHVRKDMKAEENPVRWQIFNLTFICAYQHFLLLLISTPAFIVYKHGMSHEGGTSLNLWDICCASAFVGLLAAEMASDNQQFFFQENKHKKYNLIKQGKGENVKLDPEEQDGFLSSGMWAFCRHPNYAAEQAMWISVYMFSMQFQPLNWSIIGICLLMSLFYPSAQLSEGITAKKYPAYKEFIKSRPMFLPLGGKYVAGKK